MLEMCSIETCKSLSRTQCHCCKKNFCRTHFIEHDNLPNLRLDSCVDEINLLNDRFLAFNIDKLTGDSRQKLEQWRVICHKMIDDIFEEKCREIDQRANEKIERQRNEICKMQSTVAELIRKQETTMKDIDFLKAAIHIVEEKINNMEQTCIEVVVRPLVIDNSLIRIEELYMPHLDLSILSPPYKTINYVRGSCLSFASSDRFLLVHEEPNLCLMDRDFTVVKRSQWNHGLIYDMCWSSTLSRFFVISETNVFTVDDNIMSIEPIQIKLGQRWYSCTCSDSSLFLSTINGRSSIFKFSLFPSIQLEKQWSPPETCAQNEGITNIIYKNGTLGLTILDLSKRGKLIELRLSTTLERLWSFILDLNYSIGLFGCCFLNHGDWLVWDKNTSCLLHITKDGKLQARSKYNEGLRYVLLFNGDQLAISAANGINFHRIKS